MPGGFPELFPAVLTLSELSRHLSFPPKMEKV